MTKRLKHAIAGNPSVGDVFNTLAEERLYTLLGPRLWRRVYEERCDVIRRVAGSEEDVTLPEFAFLPENRLRSERHRALLESDLLVLTEKFDALRVSVRNSIDGLPRGAASAESGVLERSFVAFAEDVAADLAAVARASRKASEHLATAESLGRFQDALVEALPSYQVASKFVGSIARKIRAG